jgi:uncharacterized membrane protein
MAERSGLDSRSREVKVAYWVMGLSLGYLIAAFLVPALLPTGTIPELSGRANLFDYATDNSWGNQPHSEGGSMGHDQSEHGGKFSWLELDPFSAFVYGFGDVNCHQKYERSWSINGNQMPVCTRDIGIFAGIAFAAFLFSRRGANRWTIRDTILSVFPDERVEWCYLPDRRFMVAFGGIALLLVPTALDGGIQAITDYESTNLKRLVTGFPMGIGIGILFSAMFAAHPKSFEFDAGRVLLPLNARLVPSAEEPATADELVEGGSTRER